jgi:hypothetical protein
MIIPVVCDSIFDEPYHVQRAGPLIEVWKDKLSDDPNANTVVVGKKSGKRKAVGFLPNFLSSIPLMD